MNNNPGGKFFCEPGLNIVFLIINKCAVSFSKSNIRSRSGYGKKYVNKKERTTPTWLPSVDIAGVERSTG